MHIWKKKVMHCSQKCKMPFDPSFFLNGPQSITYYFSILVLTAVSKLFSLISSSGGFKDLKYLVTNTLLPLTSTTVDLNSRFGNRPFNSFCQVSANCNNFSLSFVTNCKKIKYKCMHTVINISYFMQSISIHGKHFKHWLPIFLYISWILLLFPLHNMFIWLLSQNCTIQNAFHAR